MPGEGLEDHESYQQLNLVDERFAHARSVTLKQVRVVRGDFSGLSMLNLDLDDVLFEECNLSNADFSHLSGRRVVFSDCRITGLKLHQARLQAVVFLRCQGQYPQFEGTGFKRGRFEHCTLAEANFDGSDLTTVSFADCELAGATFTRARLAGADFRGSRLEASRIRLEELGGVVITPIQAAALLERQTGAVIRPED